MIVSIGMLAFNEADGIAATIQSLLAQSVFRDVVANAGVREWEIVIVPNGCTDATHTVADHALREGLAAIHVVSVLHSVRVVAEGGKSNAWNKYIHEMSRADAEIIVMMDSDIEFGHPDTLLNCLSELKNNAAAKVVVDLPLKDFVKKANPSFLEMTSIHQSQASPSADVGISGSFYCARAFTLREMWMPVGLPVEDGFLLGMIVTDLFRRDPDIRRVARAANASHYYEGLSDVRSIFHHELRLAIGTALNCYLMWDFLRFAVPADGPGAGALIRSQVQADPDWYRKLMENQINSRGLWVLPGDMTFRRFRRLRGRGWRSALRRLPVVLAGFLLDVPVLWTANSRLRSGRALGFW